MSLTQNCLKKCVFPLKNYGVSIVLQLVVLEYQGKYEERSTVRNKYVDIKIKYSRTKGVRYICVCENNSV